MAWSSKLSGVIETSTGERLATLRAAAEFIQAKFPRITKDQALVATVEDLMAAAESGKKADAAAATVQLRSFLGAQRALKGKSAPEDIQTRLRRQIERSKALRKSSRG